MAIEPLKRTGKGSPFRSETEVGELFEHLQRVKLSGWEDGRLYALMLLVCCTGIRGPAALRLRVRDFDFEAGTVSLAAVRRVKGRGRPNRVGLPEFSVPPLQEWSRRCGSDWMFPGKQTSCTWSHASANKQLDAVCVELGMVEGTTIEMVRYSVFINTLSFRMSDTGPGTRRDLRIYAGPAE